MTQLKADGVPPSEFVLGESQARDGQALLAEHFPAGSGHAGRDHRARRSELAGGGGRRCSPPTASTR